MMVRRPASEAQTVGARGFRDSPARGGVRVPSQDVWRPGGAQCLHAVLAAALALAPFFAQAADEPAIASAGSGVLGQPAAPEEVEETDPADGEERGLGVGRDAPDYRRPIDREARLIRVEPAQYPEELAGSGVSADVQLSVVVDRTGRATHIRVEDSPDELFTAAALDALAHWEWQPAVKRGRITNERVPISIPVAEEHGDLTVFDFKGGRVALESADYGAEVDEPIHRRFGVRPVYPFQMLIEGQPGEVRVEFIVGEGGVPEDVRVLEATHREFGYAALGAFHQWKFEPAQHLGRPIPARLRYRVSFQPHEFEEEMMRLAKGLRDGDLPEIVSVRDLDRQPRAAKVFYPPRLKEGDRPPERRKVSVSLLVTPSGEPLFPQVESAPDPVSGYVALSAVQYWRFTPAIQKRQPVYVHLLFPITF